MEALSRLNRIWRELAVGILISGWYIDHPITLSDLAESQRGLLFRRLALRQSISAASLVAGTRTPIRTRRRGPLPVSKPAVGILSRLHELIEAKTVDSEAKIAETLSNKRAKTVTDDEVTVGNMRRQDEETRLKKKGNKVVAAETPYDIWKKTIEAKIEALDAGLLMISSMKNPSAPSDSEEDDWDPEDVDESVYKLSLKEKSMAAFELS